MIELTPDEAEFRASVARLVDREIAPRAREFDERGEFPMELFRKIGELGYFGLRYPESVGGAGAGFVHYLVMAEELARGSMSLAAAVAMQAMMGTDFVFRCGTPDHHERLLKPALRGEKIGAFCLSEPNAGSDLARIETTARSGADGTRLTGRKMWVTNGTMADFFTVAASVDRTKGLKGIRFFLVERGAAGLHIGRRIPLVGVRADDVTELALEECPAVPLGDGGVSDLMQILDQVRAMTGALAVGLGRAALEDAVRYAKERVCFQKPVAAFQAIRHMLAQADVDLEASRLLVYQAGRRIERGLPSRRESAIAKLFASETANRIADTAMRVLAGYGFSMEYPAQRFFRDARFLLIGGGTSEILRDVIARETMGE
ncbi:MAG: acyl-CoA dehydrogenase family protein [Planctomycetes bacterium]|nr:acyl-CoA dehydrogenase family protein [Planctomycetota bacterium]